MAVPGIVNQEWEEKKNATTCALRGPRPAAAAAAAPPAFASVSPDLIFMSPKDSHCLHCRPRLCATCLGGGCANLPTPWMRGQVLRLGHKFYTGDLCAVLNPQRTPKSPTSSLFGQLLCTCSLRRLRSDSMFEPYTFIYSFWTLESLAGMSAHWSAPTLYSQTTTKCVSRADCCPFIYPRPHTLPAGQSFPASPPLRQMRWGRAGEGGARP